MTMVKSIRRKKGGISLNFIKISAFSSLVMMMVVICILSGDIPSIDTVPIDSAEMSNTLSHVSNVKSAKGIQSHEYWYEKSQPLLSDWPRLERRMDVPPILENLKLKRGIEVGVQKGILAKKSLLHWKSCEEYKLVDLWGKEDGYQEPGGHSQALKDSWLNNAKSRLKSWTKKGITEFFIMRSTDAAKKMKDSYFDYIYLDARHDFCAVKEDIEHYYPKLRPGGILGGHDYIDAQYAISKLGEHEDWSKCEDGSVHPTAVKGAVDEFVKLHGLQIITSNEDFPSWYIQKPYGHNSRRVEMKEGRSNPKFEASILEKEE